MNTFGLFLAPWDLADRGTRDLFSWARDQGINTIYLASLYHAGWFLHPHHRNHKTYMVEDGVCYFHPKMDYYADTPLKPQVAQLASNTDWIAEARNCTDSLGLQLVLWTVCLHNSRLGQLHPEVTCHNAFSDTSPHALCPSHPHVQAYVKALIRDLTTQYQPHGILIEALRYVRGRAHGSLAAGIAGHHHERDGLPLPALEQYLLDMSFAESDLDAAKQAGIDAQGVRTQVCDHLERYFASAPKRDVNMPSTLQQFRKAYPLLSEYEQCQHQIIQTLANDIQHDVSTSDVKLIGQGVIKAFDEALIGCYNLSTQEVEKKVKNTVSSKHKGQQVIVGLRLGFNPLPDSPAINSRTQLCDITRAIAEQRADGIAFYIYGETPSTALEWIRPAIQTVTESSSTTIQAEVVQQQRSPVPIGVGLIGSGSLGRVHLTALQEIPGVRLVAVMDTQIAKAKQLAKHLGIAHALDDRDRLLARDDIDLVVVATPPKYHVENAISVLEADKYLLQEKPMGRNLQDTDLILKASDNASKTIGIALVHRYESTRQAVRQLLRAGSIGSVRIIRHRMGRNMYGDSRFANQQITDRAWLVDHEIAGGGILPSSSIHTLSAISFLLDHPQFMRVSASVRSLHPEPFDNIEDDVSLQIVLENDIELVFEESWFVNIPYETFIQGDHGYLFIHGTSYFDVGLTGHIVGDVPDVFKPYCEDHHLSWRPHELDDMFSVGFRGLALDMVAVCRGESRPDLPDIQHGRNMRAVITAAIESSNIGSVVDVPWRVAQQPITTSRQMDKVGF